MKTFTVILSASRATLPATQNIMRTTQMAAEVQAITLVKPELAMGSYREEGQEFASVEQSLVARFCDSNTVEFLHRLANGYDQDSILVIDNDTGNTRLLFAAGNFEEIGNWMRVPERFAVKEQCYTMIGSYFYIVQ